MLKPEEMTVGRRNFLKAAATLPAVGAYAVTAKIAEPVNVAWIGTGGQGRVLLDQVDNSFLKVQAVADIRPDFRELGANIVRQKNNADVRSYASYKKMLEDGGFEAVVIATPLSTHAPIALDCMAAGKHVLTEKTMAYTTEDCTQMIDAANKSGLVLAVGHQRHANPLYQATKAMMEKEGEEGAKMGDVYHIRSLWHRNHSWRRNPGGEWKNEILKEKYGEYAIDGTAAMKGVTVDDIAKLSDQEQWEAYFAYLASKEPEFSENLNNPNLHAPYENADMLGNWRLYKKISHGLMSELGSHQIDVCNWFWGAEPLTVSGTGGIFHYKDGREVDDHVFVIFRYPNDKVMTFTSITTNAFDNYYDQVMGTKMTVYLTGEAQAMMFQEGAAKTAEISLTSASAGGSVSAATKSRSADMAGGSAMGSGMGGDYDPFTAYREELNMFATAIRKGDPSLVGCDGIGGRKAAIAVLKANEAMEKGTVESCVIDQPVRA
jgi:predicted dehydrogenase